MKQHLSAQTANRILTHLLVFGGLAVYGLLFGCLFRWLFGVSCPGCGLTRATLAALRLDFQAAFHYHPLFWLATPFWLYVVHRRAWGLPGSPKADRWLAVLVGVAFLGVYLIRLIWFPDEVVYVDFEQSALYRGWSFLRQLAIHLS